MTDTPLTCDVCGAPATRMVRDVQETAPVDGFRTFAPLPKVHAWCDAHVRKSRTYPYEPLADLGVRRGEEGE